MTNAFWELVEAKTRSVAHDVVNLLESERAMAWNDVQNIEEALRFISPFATPSGSSPYPDWTSAFTGRGVAATISLIWASRQQREKHSKRQD